MLGVLLVFVFFLQIGKRKPENFEKKSIKIELEKKRKLWNQKIAYVSKNVQYFDKHPLISWFSIKQNFYGNSLGCKIE